ncbi:MAG: hypothetical protein ACI4X9_05225 [Kiritimatiellia bacterium]
MKKALVALALFAAGIAAADVTSSNIVGYQKIDIPAGFAGVSPTFVSIGGGDIKLGDIVPSQEFIDEMSELQFFTKDGQVAFTAIYYPGDDDLPEGWTDIDSLEALGDTQIPFGGGFFVSSPVDASLTIKGEVKVADLGVEVPAGFKWVGNATNSDITLADIVPSQEFIDNMSELQFFTKDGQVKFTVIYYPGDDDLPEGWTDVDSLENKNGEVVESGSAVLASSESEASLTLPAPQL